MPYGTLALPPSLGSRERTAWTSPSREARVRGGDLHPSPPRRYPVSTYLDIFRPAPGSRLRPHKLVARGAGTCPPGPHFRRKCPAVAIALSSLHALQPVPGPPGVRTTTMAAATLLRVTPLFSGEGGGEGARGPRARGGRQEGPGSDPRALTPNLCPGRSWRQPDPTAAGAVAAAEGPGPVPLVPRPGRGG